MLSSISQILPMWLASTSTGRLPSVSQLPSPLRRDNCKTLIPGSSKLLRSRKSIRKSTHVALTRCSSSSPGGDPDGDNGKQSSLETISRLYNAIKERDHEELSELIRKECRPLQGRKQVLEMLSMLTRAMRGGNLVFVIRPSMKDGMEIAVEWQLEWKKSGGDPSGKGYDFYAFHLYKGKLLIRNMEMITGLLSRLETIRLKLMSFLLPLLNGIASKFSMDNKERKMLLFSIIVTLAMTISFVVFKDLPF